MCTPGLDCRYCTQYPSLAGCPRIAAAFPTDAEELAARQAKKKSGRPREQTQPQPRARSSRCSWQASPCSAPRRGHSRYCRQHAAAMARQYYAANRAVEKSKRLERYHARQARP